MALSVSSRFAHSTQNNLEDIAFFGNLRFDTVMLYADVADDHVVESHAKTISDISAGCKNYCIDVLPALKVSSIKCKQSFGILENFPSEIKKVFYFFYFFNSKGYNNLT